jgi:hypothetical protein
MPLFLEIVGFFLLAVNGFWFLATSMSEVVDEEGKSDRGMLMIRKWLLITFATTGVWIGIVMWMVVIE